MIFLGGTIASVADPEAGGNVPRLTGADIIARTPTLVALADVVPVDGGLMPASHFTPEKLFEVAQAIRTSLADPAIDGVVVAQGTDSIEESSFFWDLVHDSDKTAVVTGAMRASSDPGYDGPANLADSVRAAVAPALRGEGVLVALAGSVHAADDVVKTHASSLTAFQSPNAGPLATVEAGRVTVLRRRVGRRRVRTTRAAERVHLVTATVGTDGSLVDAARTAGMDGLVVAAAGVGNTSLPLLEAATRAIGDGIPVVLTTRSQAGRAGPVYAFPGGGATWVRAGAILAGSLGGPKARIALMLGIGAGLDRDGLATLLADPTRGDG
jgi:L-asparaginase